MAPWPSPWLRHWSDISKFPFEANAIFGKKQVIKLFKLSEIILFF